MRTILLLIAFFSIHNAMAQGDLSGSLKGQQQTQKALFGTLEVKNKQSTKTGAVSALIEERSLLENGSFEHQAYQSGWTVTGSATISRETTIVRDGRAAFKAVTAGNSFRIEQNTTQLQGTNVPAYAIVWVHNTAPGVQVCSMLAGSDKDCVTALTDGAWRFYVVPMILGATSNGISVHSGTTAGTTYVDWVRLVDEDLVGTSPVAGPEIAYTPVFSNVNTPTNINFTYQQIGSSILVKGYYTGAGGTSTNEIRIGLPTGLTTSSKINPIQSLGILNSSNSTFDANFFILATANKNYLNVGLFAGGLSGLSVANTSSAGFSSGRNFSFEVLVPVNELQSSVPTYSGRCNDPFLCETSPAAVISSAPAVTSTNVDFISSVTGTSTKTINFTAGKFTVTPSCKCIPVPGASSADNTCSIASQSSSSLVVQITNANTLANAAINITCDKQGQDYINAKVNQIVGSFKDYVRTPNTATGKVGFCSAKISATGVISDQLGGCFASCTNATTPVCTFTSNYWKSGSVPNCSFVNTSGTQFIQGTATVSSTTFSGAYTDGTSAPQSGTRMYQCHGEIQ